MTDIVRHITETTLPKIQTLAPQSSPPSTTGASRSGAAVSTPVSPQSRSASVLSFSQGFHENDSYDYADTPLLPALSPSKIEEETASATEQHSTVTAELPVGLTFCGEATFPCDVVIHGAVEGKINTDPAQKITIYKEARINGDVAAKSVHVYGSVNGSITGEGGLVAFESTAVCTGEVTYSRLSIADGAEVEATMKKVATKI